MLEHFTLARCWPHRDTALTVFRYELVRRLCAGKRVLEIGAASGEGTALFADAAREVVALDHQDLWADSPCAGMAHVSFVRSDALAMPREWAGRFDVVIALEFVEHIEDVEALQRAVYDVLSEDGVFLLSTPNFDLYSDRGDGSRRPLYAMHRREYRAAELAPSFLDRWRSVEQVGMSQLSAPAAADQLGERDALICFADRLYRLVFGGRYPDRRLVDAGTRCALPLSFSQSFVCALSKGAAPDVAGLFADVQPGAPVTLSTEEAAFQSARMILQRRNEHCAQLNEHCAQLEGGLDLMKRHATALQEIVRTQEERIAAASPPLCARMSQTVPPPEITDEGETG